MEHTNKLLVICGPTATGKTALALSLAKQFNGELVSADSRQVYRGMDIGTGKDKQAEIPVWLHDVVRPDQEFSVAQYESLARDAIEDIHRRGKLPILVGGTGLYIKAILEGIPSSIIPRNEQLRNNLEQKTVSELQQILQERSLDVWNGMNNSDRNNPRRLIRKIEITHASIPMPKTLTTYNSLVIGLKTDPAVLEQKISSRVLERVDQGIIPEIETLLQKGYDWNLPALNTFGYKEWQEYFQIPSETNKQHAIETWINDEIGYVKKQLTWFKKQKNIEWLDSTDSNLAEKASHAVKLWYTST